MQSIRYQDWMEHVNGVCSSTDVRPCAPLTDLVCPAHAWGEQVNQHANGDRQPRVAADEAKSAAAKQAQSALQDAESNADHGDMPRPFFHT